jgi:lantibiotic modifying enzyme
VTILYSARGAEVETLDYAEALVTGFTSIYTLLLTHQDGLLAANGPLARFMCDDVRVILRPTRTYAVLLQESFHPDVLRDALDRDRLFDRLWVEIESLPYLAKLTPAEREER